MLKRFRKKVQDKAQAVTAEVESQVEEKVEQVKTEAESKIQDKVEEVQAEVTEIIDDAQDSVDDAKCKLWIMNNLCCCFVGEEERKASAIVTDHADAMLSKLSNYNEELEV